MLILGFVLLIKGADFFVEGSSAVARKLHIPAMVIGMTIPAGMRSQCDGIHCRKQ